TERAGSAIKAAYLSSPTTALKKTASDVALAGVEGLVTQPTAVAVDYVRALAQSARTGFRMKPHEFRALASTLDATGLRIRAKGFMKGLRDATELMRSGVDADYVNSTFDLHRVTFRNPVINHAMHAVFNVLEGATKPWYSMHFETSLYARAKLAAIREGLTGKAATARVNALLANPTDEMVVGAVDDASYLTLKNQTALSQFATAGKRKLLQVAQGEIPEPPPAAGPETALQRGKRLGARALSRREVRQTAKALSVASEAVLPFVGVPGSIAGKMIDYSPLGFATTMARQLSPATRSAAGFATGLSRAAAGTAATFTLGYALAREGKLTGATVTPEQRAEGAMPNSIRVDGHWLSLAPLEAVAFPALLAANLHDASKERQAGLLDTAAQVAGTELQELTEQSFLMGIKNLMDAAGDAQHKASRFVAGLVPIPAVSNRLAQATDQTVRAPTTFTQRLEARVPGLSQNVPAMRDVFGEPVTRDGSTASRAAHALLDPFNTQRATPTPLLDELNRLGVQVGRPSRTIHVGRQSVPLTDEQYDAYVEQTGQMTKRALEALMNDPGYAGASDEQRADAMRRVIDQVRAAVRNQAKAEWARTHHDTP
ncbi:MAG TPA: hypothetical protein VFF44_12300, partial [Casimicrobiaceae bacterium]|nr:hypothetical protein [Casimicrobiaceae bacterium]